jgi:hypothetical protein
MKIDYYRIQWEYRRITDCSIDSESDSCVSYTRDSVTVKEAYEESYSGRAGEEQVTYSQSFEAAKKELAEVFRKEIADYQQKLSNLENSADYERYCSVKYL